MPRLMLKLLGPLQAVLEEQPLVGFRSDKARALLVFLAVESGRPHARDALAALLWPDYSNTAALTSLRVALANLRQLLDTPAARPSILSPLFLLITRETVQFNPTADAWLDVVALARLLEGHPTLSALEQAVGLCRGPFLEGFSIGHSAAFDEWLLFKREQFNRQTLLALHHLTGAYLAQHQYSQAEDGARRQLALDPWDERAYRQLRLSLALSGRGSDALSEYETCRRLLARELGVAPARETTDLRNSIQADILPEVLACPNGITDGPDPFFGRAYELATLDTHLALALANHGGVVFVTGEAGVGKTTLVHEFARRAMAAQRSAVVAGGKCSSLIGLDDPYLPFREVVQMLTGDIEIERSGGGITLEHAQRLWDLVPTAVEALIESAPGLVNRFVDADTVALRVEAAAKANGRATTTAGCATLAERVRRQAQRNTDAASLERTDLFEQVTAFLRALARHHPLILLLDDLQWADNGSINLLFHLARYLAGSRILIVALYRREDVALGRDGGRHPLAAVAHELRREFGDIELDLDRASGQLFIDALLDSEPNRLDETFRDTLYHHTEGHALFAVELLRSLQANGGLERDEAGNWVEGAALDWETLPARVEAVIAEHIGRLPADVQATLSAASVEGEEFAAEVVAQVRDLEERELKAQLVYASSHDYQLLRSHSTERVNGRRLFRYRFRHRLFWQYLYNQIDEVERVRLHEAVGLALESLYTATQDQLMGRAPQLAWHFEEAGLYDKAVSYRRVAGDQAMSLSAWEEAVAHYTRALALLATLPASPARAEQEAGVRLALATPLYVTRGWGGPEVRSALTRAYELSQTTGASPQLVATLLALIFVYIGQGEAQKALALGQELLHLAEQAEDGLSLAAAHQAIGLTLSLSGEIEAARTHLVQALALYDNEPEAPPLLIGVDQKVSCLTWLAWTLWPLGYANRAAECGRAALARARELDESATLAFALALDGAMFHTFRGEPEAAQACQEELLRLAQDKGLVTFQVLAAITQGFSRVERGQIEGGIAQIQQGAAAWQAMGTVALRVLQMIVLIRAYRAAGQIEQARRVVTEELTLVERNGLHYGEAKLWRLKGELLLSGENVDETAAEACFYRAITIAQRQGARLWELRAIISLVRLWQRQGRHEDARQRLAAIYGWFSEGFETSDLIEARALLEELTHSLSGQSKVAQGIVGDLDGIEP
ncbi:MAG: AAA family ATPase [Anaerolineae bacterium]